MSSLFINITYTCQTILRSQCLIVDEKFLGYSARWFRAPRLSPQLFPKQGHQSIIVITLTQKELHIGLGQGILTYLFY